MSTSDIKKRSLRTFVSYLTVSFLCCLFGSVYEMFSHGVLSLYMIFCFMPPLLLGSVPFIVIYFTGKGFPGRLAYNLYNSGVAALTVGLIFSGVLQIYGTTNRLSAVYYITAALFITSGLVCRLCEAKKNKNALEKVKNV